MTGTGQAWARGMDQSHRHRVDTQNPGRIADLDGLDSVPAEIDARAPAPTRGSRCWPPQRTDEPDRRNPRQMSDAVSQVTDVDTRPNTDWLRAAERAWSRQALIAEQSLQIALVAALRCAAAAESWDLRQVEKGVGSSEWACLL